MLIIKQEVNCFKKFVAKEVLNEDETFSPDFRTQIFFKNNGSSTVWEVLAGRTLRTSKRRFGVGMPVRSNKSGYSVCDEKSGAVYLTASEVIAWGGFMGEGKTFFRFVALLLLPVFFAESVWSMPAAEWFSARTASVKQADPIFSNHPDLLLLNDMNWVNPPQVPSQMGERVESFSGKAPFRALIVQDAHALPEAQKSAAKIIDFWVSRLGLQFVGLEGAKGDLPHSAVAAFPNRAARTMLAETLLEEAVIGGPEYLQMTKHPSLKLRGVEDMGLYESDRVAFLKVVNERDDALKILNTVRSRTEEEALKILPVEYLRFRKHARQAHENGDWQKHLLNLQSMRLDNRLTGRYPAFDFWRKAHELSDQVNPEIMESEIRGLKKKGALGLKLAEYGEKVLRGESLDADLKTEVLLWKESPTALKNYPVTVSALKAAYLMRRVGTGLFDEVARLEKELTEKACPESGQKEIVRRLENLDISRSLVMLSLTASDYEEFLSRRDEFKAEALGKANQTVFSSDEKKVLSETMTAAMSFYHIAMRRDEALAQNFISELKKENQKVGALVIGGFHTAGLLRVLREQGISYEVVRPKIKTTDFSKYQTIYEKRMSSQLSKLEWVRPENLEDAQFKSHSQLQLQTPRRMEKNFPETLYALLSGTAAALSGRPVETEQILTSSAFVLSDTAIAALRELDSFSDRSRVWISPDGQDTVFWFLGTEGQTPLLTSAGPHAKTRAGKGASMMRFDGREVWIRRGGSSPEAALPNWKRSLPARSELRGDDDLARITWAGDFKALEEIEKFKRALALRLEVFAESLRLKNTDEIQKISSAGMALDFKYENGRVEIIRFSTNWKDRSAAVRAMMLIYWEEYLSGMSLIHSQGVHAAAVAERVAKRFTNRIVEDNFVPRFLDSQVLVEKRDLWQNLIFSLAALSAAGVNDKKNSFSVFDLLGEHNRLIQEGGKTGRQIDLPSSPDEIENWRQALSFAEKEMSAEMIRRLNLGEIEAQLLQAEIPDFLLRYGRIKIILGEKTGTDFKEGFQNGALLWAEALIQAGEKKSLSKEAPLAQSESVKILLPEIVEEAPVLPHKTILTEAERGGSLEAGRWFEGLPDLAVIKTWGGDEGFEKLEEISKRLSKIQNLNPEGFGAGALEYWEAVVARMKHIRQGVPDTIPVELDEKVTDDGLNTAELDTEPVFSGKTSSWTFPVFEIVLTVAVVSFLSLPFLGMTLPVVLGLDLAAALSTSGLTAAAGALLLISLRAGYLAGMMLNEWGHLIASAFMGKVKTIKNFHNWTGNRNIFRLLAGLMPFTPMPSAYVQLDQSETKGVGAVRIAGFVLGVMAFAALVIFFGKTLLLFIPIMFFYTGVSGGILAKIAASISDIFNPPSEDWLAACGNTSIMGFVKKPADLDKYLARLKESIIVTEKRGKIAIGFFAIMEDLNGNQEIVHEKYYIDSRQTAADVFENQFKPLVLKRARAMKIPFYIHIGDHLRFPTAGAKKGDFSITAIENGAHPHGWVGQRESKVLTGTAKGFEYIVKKVYVVLGHNGDFNDLVKTFSERIRAFFSRRQKEALEIELDGKAYSNQQIAWVLKRIKGIYNPTTGDSPKLSGVQDLVYVQGRWEDTVQFAHYASVAPDLEYYFGGFIPKNDAEEAQAPNHALKPGEVKVLAAFLEQAFAQAGGMDKIRGLTDLADISDEDLGGLQEKILTQMNQASGSAQALFKQMGEKESAQFIETAVYAFLRHNLLNSWIYISKNVRGSAGVNAYSSLQPRTKISFSLGQNITLGFGKKNGMVQVGSNSEANAGRVDGYEFLLDLNGLGEVAEVTHDGETIGIKVYSLTLKDENGASGRFLTQDEIYARLRPAKPIEVSQNKDPAQLELNSIPAYLKVIRDEFKDPRDLRRPKMPPYTAEKHNFFVMLEIIKVILAGPIGRLIMRQSRVGIESGLGDDVFMKWAEVKMESFLADLGLVNATEEQKKSARQILVAAFRRDISNLIVNPDVVKSVLKPFALEIAGRHLNSSHNQESISQETIRNAVTEFSIKLLSEYDLSDYRDLAAANLLKSQEPLLNALKENRLDFQLIQSFLPQADEEPHHSYDAVFFGKEKNEQILKMIEKILKKVYPHFQTRVYDSNEIDREANAHLRDKEDASKLLPPGEMDVEGFKEQLSLTNPFVVAIASSGSGQHFNSSTGALMLARVIEELFVATADEHSQMSRAVGLERTLIIRTEWSPTELGMGAYASTRATFMELVSSAVRSLPSQIAGRPIFGSEFTDDDINFLEKEWDHFIDQTAPAVLGQKSDDENTHTNLVKAGKSFGRRISESTVSLAAAWVYIGLTVAGKVPSLFAVLHGLGGYVSAVLALSPVTLFLAIFTVIAITAWSIAVYQSTQRHAFSGKTRDYQKAAVWTFSLTFFAAQIFFLPGLGDALFYMFFAFPIFTLGYRWLVSLRDGNTRSFFDRGGMKFFSFVGVQEEVGKILETVFRKSFSQSYGINGAHAEATSADRMLDDQIGGNRAWINLGFLNKSGVPALADDLDALQMVFKQLITILSQVLFPYSYLFGLSLVGAHNVLIGDEGSKSEKASQQHITISTATKGDISKRRLAQQLFGLALDDFRLVLSGYVLIHSIAAYTARPVWYRPWSYIVKFNPNNTRSGAGTHTTASPRSADHLLPHLQVMDSILRPIRIEGLEPKRIEPPDYMHFPDPNRKGPPAQSAPRMKKNPRLDAMDRAIQEAQAALEKAQREFIQEKERQFAEVEKEVRFEGGRISAKPEIQYATAEFIRRELDSRGLNGMEPEIAEPYRQKLVSLSAALHSDENAYGEKIKPDEMADFFDRYRSQPKEFVKAVAYQLFSRSEVRQVSLAERSEVKGAGLLSGLQAQDAMRSGIKADQMRSEMRELMALPKRTLQEASSRILGNQISDSGVVIFERPYDPKWIRRFMAKMPAGVRIVMRAPAENVIDRALYSRELAAEIRRGIFSFEFSEASSESWMRNYLGAEFDPTNVIQVESPEKPSEADDEMLLLSAPMAAGHVLVLGQPQRLNLPGMRWIQISAWISQLYDVVKVTQTSA